MTFKHSRWHVLLTLGLLASASGCGSKNGAGDASPKRTDADAKPLVVRVIRPAEGPFERVTTQPAHVEPYEKIDVLAKVSGYVLKLGQVKGKDGKLRDVDIGDRVTIGDPLVFLKVPELEQEVRQKEAMLAKAKAEVVQAEAAVKSATAMTDAARAKISQAAAEIRRAKADVAYREVEKERYERMLKERTIQPELASERLNLHKAALAALDATAAAEKTAKANLEVEEARRKQADADLLSAKARQQVADAELAQAQAMVDYTRIKARFTGIITQRRVDTGTFVQAATSGKPEPLFKLAKVDRLRVVADIPETDAALIALNQAATLRVDSLRGKSLTGKVVRYADALDPATRTMRVEVELDEHPAMLRPGMFGTITIVLFKHPKALLLPMNALILTGEEPAVMVVEKGVAQRQMVKIDENDGIRARIVSGIKAGDQVIVEGKESVHNGQRVEVK